MASNYNLIDNDQIVDIYKNICKQLLELSKPMGDIILKYSRLRNEFSILSNEINDRVEKKKIDITKYDSATQEIINQIGIVFKEIADKFPTTEEKLNDK